MKNIFKYIALISISLFLFLSQGGKPQYDPWGVWNDCPVSENDRIRTFSTGKYYEVPFGLYIVKHCREAVAGGGNFPAIAIPGEYIKIEKYEPIEDGFIFYLVGDGFKSNNKGTLFQDNTRMQLKMYYIDEGECYFEYISPEDENGYHLSRFVRENVVYKRLRVKS
jgi:hypothetical protein